MGEYAGYSKYNRGKGRGGVYRKCAWGYHSIVLELKHETVHVVALFVDNYGWGVMLTPQVERIKRRFWRRIWQFQIGGVTLLNSIGEYSLPVVIAGRDVTIRTYVVDSDIPFYCPD